MTDTFIEISSPPCTNGEAIGSFLWSSTLSLAPSPIENQMYRESFLGTCPTTVNPIFPYIVTFTVTANLSYGLLCSLLNVIFCSNIRFPANSVWEYMVPSQSCVGPKVVSYGDVTMYLMLLNASLLYLCCFGLLKPLQCNKISNPWIFESKRKKLLTSFSYYLHSFWSFTDNKRHVAAEVLEKIWKSFCYGSL